MARHRWDPVAPAPRGLVRPVRVDPRGVEGPTRHEAERQHHWRRTSQGFHVPAYVSDDLPEQRILEQSARMPAQGAVTGWAACRLHGAAFFDGLDRDGLTRLPVPINVGQSGHIAVDDRVTLYFHHLRDHERTTRHGIPTVTADRATFDAMRRVDTREAVVALDMMAAAERVSVRSMKAYVARHATRREDHLTDAVVLASEHSRSPNETRLRLVLVLDAGLSHLLVNATVLDRDGHFLGIADLLDPEAGLVIEYDGAEHRAARRQAQDVAKEDRLRRAGLEVARITGPDLGHRDVVVERVLAARSRARFLPPGRRLWVANPPRDDLHERIEARLREDAYRQELESRGS